MSSFSGSNAKICSASPLFSEVSYTISVAVLARAVKSLAPSFELNCPSPLGMITPALARDARIPKSEIPRKLPVSGFLTVISFLNREPFISITLVSRRVRSCAIPLLCASKNWSSSARLSKTSLSSVSRIFHSSLSTNRLFNSATFWVVGATMNPCIARQKPSLSLFWRALSCFGSMLKGVNPY